MSITSLAHYEPQHLTPEPWGNRMARARELAGFTLRQVETALDNEISRATVGRLEKLDAEPTDKRRRRQAVTLLVLYGFDPADFGLNDDDAPSIIDLRMVREQGKASTIWYAAAA